MSNFRKFYFIGFAIYLFSFALPAIPIFNEPVAGYYLVYWTLKSLFVVDAIDEFAFNALAILPNVLVIICFILHFKVDYKKLIILQVIAFLSALFWAVLDLVQEKSFGGLFIGYWDWLFGIFFMLIVMLTFGYRNKRNGISQQPTKAFSRPRGACGR
jgi:hypothetical protein